MDAESLGARAKEWLALATISRCAASHWPIPSLESYRTAKVGPWLELDARSCSGGLAFEREIISKDLNRFLATSPKQASMRELIAPHFETDDGAAFHGSIRRILHAWQQRKRRVGYAQGMHVIAGTLLAIAGNEDDAFVLFCALMERALPSDFLTPPPAAMNGLMALGDVLVHLALELYPGFGAFDSLKALLNMFGCCAMVQLFADVVPLPALLVVWDALFRSCAKSTRAGDPLIERRSLAAAAAESHLPTQRALGSSSADATTTAVQRAALHVESTGTPLLVATLALLHINEDALRADAAPNALLKLCHTTDADELFAAMKIVKARRGIAVPWGESLLPGDRGTALGHRTLAQCWEEDTGVLVTDARVQLFLYEAKLARTAKTVSGGGDGGYCGMLLSQLQRATSFSRETLEEIMAVFEREEAEAASVSSGSCFSGGLSEGHFTKLVSHCGVDDCTVARLIFTACDRDRSGRTNFQDLCLVLSVLCHGSVAARLELCFDSFDTANVGVLNAEQLSLMIAILLRSRSAGAKREEGSVETAQRWLEAIAPRGESASVNVADFIRNVSAAKALLTSVELPCFGFSAAGVVVPDDASLARLVGTAFASASDKEATAGDVLHTQFAKGSISKQELAHLVAVNEEAAAQYEAETGVKALSKVAAQKKCVVS
mgnify:CR=1 FL=1